MFSFVFFFPEVVVGKGVSIPEVLPRCCLSSSYCKESCSNGKKTTQTPSLLYNCDNEAAVSDSRSIEMHQHLADRW